VIRIERRVAHETAELAVDRWFVADVGNAGDLAAQSQFCVFRNEAQTGTPLLQRRRDRVLIVSDAGNDAKTGDGNPTQLAVVMGVQGFRP